MRLSREAVEVVLSVVDLEPEPVAGKPSVAVAVPIVAVADDAPTSLTVKAEMVEGFLNLFPERSYRHRALVKAVG